MDGFVYDASTDLPLEDAEITIGGVKGIILSDSEGRYAFPTPGSGEFDVTVTKEGYTKFQHKVTAVGTRDVALKPARLTPLDSKVTPIIASEGGTATDSTDMIELDILNVTTLIDLNISNIIPHNGLNFFAVNETLRHCRFRFCVEKPALELRIEIAVLHHVLWFLITSPDEAMRRQNENESEQNRDLSHRLFPPSKFS